MNNNQTDWYKQQRLYREQLPFETRIDQAKCRINERYAEDKSRWSFLNTFCDNLKADLSPVEYYEVMRTQIRAHTSQMGDIEKKLRSSWLLNECTELSAIAYDAQFKNDLVDLRRARQAANAQESEMAVEA